MNQSRRARGKAALFSSDRPAARRGGGLPTGGGRSWTVACRSCRAETPVTGAELVRALARPGALWWPLSRHANRMACHACGDMTWCQVRWRPPRTRG